MPAPVLRIVLATLTLAVCCVVLLFVSRGEASRDPRVDAELQERIDAFTERALLARELRGQYVGPVSDWPEPTLLDGAVYTPLGALPEMPHPLDNPFSEEKVTLGKVLFFDPRLSTSGMVSCASCHDPDLGWADGRRVSFGHGRQTTSRNAPTVLNSGHLELLMWDGRAESLEEQAVLPMTTGVEMAGSANTQALDDMVDRLGAIDEYAPLFDDAFGSADVTVERVTQALATFQRTLVSGRSRFDRFLDGNGNALNDAELRGLHLFRTTALCINCHSGPTMTDQQFHNLATSHFATNEPDLGRFVVTGDEADRGAFRTPGLRDIERTAPYLHHGVVDMPALLGHYNRGMFPAPDGQTKSPLIKPLGLTADELEDLRAFLESLTEPRVPVVIPELPGAE